MYRSPTAAWRGAFHRCGRQVSDILSLFKCRSLFHVHNSQYVKLRHATFGFFYGTSIIYKSYSIRKTVRHVPDELSLKYYIFQYYFCLADKVRLYKSAIIWVALHSYSLWKESLLLITIPYHVIKGIFFSFLVTLFIVFIYPSFSSISLFFHFFLFFCDWSAWAYENIDTLTGSRRKKDINLFCHALFQL